MRSGMKLWICIVIIACLCVSNYATFVMWDTADIKIVVARAVIQGKTDEITRLNIVQRDMLVDLTGIKTSIGKLTSGFHVREMELLEEVGAFKVENEALDEALQCARKYLMEGKINLSRVTSGFHVREMELITDIERLKLEIESLHDLKATE